MSPKTVFAEESSSLTETAAVENHGYSNEKIETLITDLINWKKANTGLTNNESMFSEEFLAQAGTTGDWYALSFGRLGYENNFSPYLDAVSANVFQRYEQPEKLDKAKSTEWHRISLAILACGGDPTALIDAESNQHINLIADGTFNRGKEISFDVQGLNAWIFALITLDSMRYEVPEDAFNTRDDFIKEILACQVADGGFGSDPSSPSSADFTSMVLCALAPYYNSEQVYEIQTSDGTTTNKTVREAIDNALIRLSEIQNPDGDYGTAESCAAVLTALSILGVDSLNDSRFIKNEKTVLDGLLLFRQNDGGFAHSLEEATSNSMTGSSVLYSMVSLLRYKHDLRTLYDFRPEMDSMTKLDIKKLVADIDTLSKTPEQSNEENVKEAFDAYLNIPISERSYVYNYYVLADAMKQLNIENTSEYLSEHMDINSSGNGTVISLISPPKIDEAVKENPRSLNGLFLAIIAGIIALIIIVIILITIRKRQMKTLINTYSSNNSKPNDTEQ